MSLQQILTYNPCSLCERVNVNIIEQGMNRYQGMCQTLDCDNKTALVKDKPSVIKDWNKHNNLLFIPIQNITEALSSSNITQIILNKAINMPEFFVSKAILEKHNLGSPCYDYYQYEKCSSYIFINLLKEAHLNSYITEKDVFKKTNFRGIKLKCKALFKFIGLKNWNGKQLLEYAFKKETNSFILDLMPLVNAPINQEITTSLE